MRAGGGGVRERPGARRCGARAAGQARCRRRRSVAAGARRRCRRDAQRGGRAERRRSAARPGRRRSARLLDHQRRRITGRWRCLRAAQPAFPIALVPDDTGKLLWAMAQAARSGASRVQRHRPSSRGRDVFAPGVGESDPDDRTRSLAQRLSRHHGAGRRILRPDEALAAGRPQRTSRASASTSTRAGATG